MLLICPFQRAERPTVNSIDARTTFNALYLYEHMFTNKMQILAAATAVILAVTICLASDSVYDCNYFIYARGRLIMHYI